MLAYMLGNGARIVLVESASRFARDHIVQDLGHQMLKRKGIELIPVDAPSHFTEDSPIAQMVRTIISAVSQFEKEALVLKLRKARERKRRDTGSCEGRTSWKPAPQAAVEAARAAHAKGQSLRAISATLFAQGFHTPSGKAYGAQSVALMIDRAHVVKLRAERREAKRAQRAA